MDSIIHYRDYKEYVLDYRASLPSKGRGFFKRIADHLKIVPVVVSQIFKGDRHLSSEQALELSDLLKLSKFETKYFLLLVQLERAATRRLKNQIEEEIQSLRDESLQLSSKLPKDKNLNEEAKARFYSDWAYSAIRISTDLPQMNSAGAVSEYLRIPKQKVEEILSFLLSSGLVVSKDHQFHIGPQRTHLDSRSDWIQVHHQNWRRKSIEKMAFQEKEDLFYSGAMTLSKRDFENIREQLAAEISDVVQTVSESKSEEIFCLNLDWFQLLPRK